MLCAEVWAGGAPGMVEVGLGAEVVVGKAAEVMETVLMVVVVMEEEELLALALVLVEDKEQEKAQGLDHLMSLMI